MEVKLSALPTNPTPTSPWCPLGNAVDSSSKWEGVKGMFLAPQMQTSDQGRKPPTKDPRSSTVSGVER